ncbi:hypothetical protein ACQ4PT_018816 [Festuca glaucescens]
MDAQRALLDALLGSSQNMTEDEKKDHREPGGGVGRPRRLRPLHGPLLPARPLHQHQEQPRQLPQDPRPNPQAKFRGLPEVCCRTAQIRGRAGAPLPEAGAGP